jgi:lipopolysaccharide heptosyltransferase II
MSSPANLLIVRTDRIGDVVLSLPLAGAIKKYYPECRITFLLREYTKPLAENHPYVDEVLVLSDENGPSLFKNIKLLKSKKFDACIIVNPGFKSSLILFLSKIKIRIGTGYRLYSFLFNKRVYEHRKYGEKHEFEFNLNLLKEIGINEKISENNTRFFLNIKSESLEKIKKMLTELEIVKNDKLVLIHPGSGGSAVDLPLQKMKELHKRISQLDNVKIIVTGSSDEIDICNLVNNNDSIFNLAGKLNLNELSALISLTDLFISNSTGPIHIAAALDRWIIGFYPKIPACSQNRWGPYTKKKYIFTPAIDCVNCSRQQCEKLDCMNTIDIGKVFEQARNVLIK